ncbi:MAG: GNAT family N-acetyltransferase [Sphaerobacteraceae bacterium]|nr:MAG: GNAT family N-acetyltransferase [Sphaerobacteraceae bacterium]
MPEGSNLSLRVAVPADAERCKELGVTGWETTYSGYVHEHNRRAYLNGDFWSIERLRAVLADDSAVNLVVELEGRVVGFITTEALEDGRYEVTRLYVDPEVRSRGIGARLLQSVFDELRRRGVAEVIVNVFGDNHAGRRFYERHGFQLTDDVWCMVGDQQLRDVWYSQRL